MIRHAEEKDTDSYYELICELENQKFAYGLFCDLYRRLLHQDMYEMFVYEENQTVIAVMTLFFSEKLHHNGLTGEILELDVREEFRGRGIGEKMLQTALEASKKRQCLEMELSSSMRRTAAHRFYERYGFRKDHFNFTLPLR